MLVALLVGAGASAPPVTAFRDLAAAAGPIDPLPGAWVEYLVRSRGADAARVRITALPASGEGRYFLELAVVSSSGVAGAARILAHGTALSGADIERIDVMLAGQQPIAIPLDRDASPAKPGSGRESARRLRAARVRVPAGIFAAEVLTFAGARVWRAAGVPLWGVVKARTRTRSVEMLASGLSGGHSVFPEGRVQGNGSESAK